MKTIINDYIETAMQAISDTWKSYWTEHLTANIVINGLEQVRNAVEELKKLDSVLADISKKTGNLSKQDLSSLGETAFETAGKYGKQAYEYLDTIQKMTDAGYDNLEGMAELSLMTQSAGTITAELANQFIWATDKAYRLYGNISQLSEVLGGCNHIAKYNTVHMQDLAEGMSIMGSQAAAAGMEADQAAAALAAMIAVTKQDGSETATAFQVILKNLQQITSDEEHITAEGLDKYKQACEALNVSLKETHNGITSLRDPMKILEDLSAVYVTLPDGDIRKTNLLEAVGGAQTSNALNAILENWDIYEKMLQDYADGTGSLYLDAAASTSAYEGALNRLSNTWTETVGNFAESDGIVTGINALNNLLHVLNDLTSLVGTSGSWGLGLGALFSLGNHGSCV